MMNPQKYRKGYFMPPACDMRWMMKDAVDHAPIWCSVDLRDGNQALVIPMSLEEKLEFYQKLIAIGFKEIEVGFPAASETEYAFLRTLVEKDMIPDDVTVQVLTQARDHIIRRTFEALDGVKNAIVHVYNSTSVAQREQVFHKSKDDIKAIAIEGATMLKELTEAAGRAYRFEYSPESFTGTEVDYALDVCNAVLDVWQPTAERKAIINLPSTVQLSMPHVYGMQIAYMDQHLKYRDSVILSLHPHNDRGSGVADAEMGLLAGADRIEGTLFGNGERTGNVDIVTVAMNMYTHGIDPHLDFTHMPQLIEMYERLTRMKVGDRQPYAGKLVFAAFSGSHQDAIAKGMKHHAEGMYDYWNVPYLPLDPEDIGRKYEADVIRINSQSGKGGVAYILENTYGIRLPKDMREGFGYLIKDISDKRHQELSPEEIKSIFETSYVNRESPIALSDFHFRRSGDTWKGCVTLSVHGREKHIEACGKGQLDAISRALCKTYDIHVTHLVYEEHDLDRDPASRGIAYFGLTDETGKTTWGAGIDRDTITASVKAFLSAVNRMDGISEKVSAKRD